MNTRMHVPSVSPTHDCRPTLQVHDNTHTRQVHYSKYAVFRPAPWAHGRREARVKREGSDRESPSRIVSMSFFSTIACGEINSQQTANRN